MTTGIDLRLMEGEDFRRTQLLKDGPAVEVRGGGVAGEVGCQGLGVSGIVAVVTAGWGCWRNEG